MVLTKGGTASQTTRFKKNTIDPFGTAEVLAVSGHTARPSAVPDCFPGAECLRVVYFCSCLVRTRGQQGAK